MKQFFLVLLAVLMLNTPAHSVTPNERLNDPQLEERAREISKELRCVVCQNQSIDDSDAQLAKNLRKLVRERLIAGDSNEQVMDFVTQRYGDFVLLKPRFGGQTLLLWLAPIVFVGFGFALAFVFFKRRTEVDLTPPLSANEQEQLKKLIQEAEKADHVQ